MGRRSTGARTVSSTSRTATLVTATSGGGRVLAASPPPLEQAAASSSEATAMRTGALLSLVGCKRNHCGWNRFIVRVAPSALHGHGNFEAASPGGRPSPHRGDRPRHHARPTDDPHRGGPP